MDEAGQLAVTFTGVLTEWRGPAPFHFLPMPEDDSAFVKDVAVIYWGVAKVTARIGGTTFTTALFPRQGVFWLPVKDAVRRAEDLELGDEVEATLFLAPE